MRSLQISIDEVIAQNGANAMLTDQILLPLLVIASDIEHQSNTIRDSLNACIFDKKNYVFGEFV